MTESRRGNRAARHPNDARTEWESQMTESVRQSLNLKDSKCHSATDTKLNEAFREWFDSMVDSISWYIVNNKLLSMKSLLCLHHGEWCKQTAVREVCTMLTKCWNLQIEFRKRDKISRGRWVPVGGLPLGACVHYGEPAVWIANFSKVESDNIVAISLAAS